MTIKYFVTPFATSGDVLAIPDPTQPSGVVSYAQGFGPDYQLIDTDPASLNIPRNQFNQLMLDITGAIQQIQQNGIPYFITSTMNDGSPFPYAINAIVYQPVDGNVYQSTVGANTNVPPGTGWQLFGVSTSLWLNYSADTGTANAYAVAPMPAITAYGAGQTLILKPLQANTAGACNINVSGLGNVRIKTMGNLDPAAGMISPPGAHILFYNGANFVLLNPTLGSAAYANIGAGASQVPTNSLLGSAAYAVLGEALGDALQAIFTNPGGTAGSFQIGPWLVQFAQGVSDFRWQQTFNTFPIAFSAAPIYCNFVPILSASPPNFTTGVQDTPNISGVTKFGFYAQQQDNGQNTPCCYLAIGLA